MHKDTIRKVTSSLFLSEMIAELDRSHHKTRTKQETPHTVGETRTKELTIELPHKNI